MVDIQEKAYKYTAAGDITRITDTKGAQNITYNYGYDKLHRLISEASTGGSDSFNAVILSKTFDETAPLHAVKSVKLAGVNYPYLYDANGNMTTGWDFKDPTQVAGRTITYNGDNMPEHIERSYSSNTTTVDLFYDGEGTRVKKAVLGGGTTYYIGDHFEVANGIETKYIFGGNLRIAKVTSANRYFYHKDHLGSSTVMTRQPDGWAIEAAEYLPFGLTRKRSGTEVTYYRFTDQELDSEIGLYNYNARLYDPAVGIFVSPDSIVPDRYDQQALNRYAYVRNNPLIYKDPNGHCFVSDLIEAAKKRKEFRQQQEEMWNKFDEGDYREAEKIHEKLDSKEVEVLDKTMDAIKETIEFETDVPSMIKKPMKEIVRELAEDHAEDPLDEAVEDMKDPNSEDNESNNQDSNDSSDDNSSDSEE